MVSAARRFVFPLPVNHETSRLETAEPVRGDRRTDEIFASAIETIRAVLRRKSGMSLRDDDTRAANVEAIEVQHDVTARLWERLVDDVADKCALGDAAAYAATMAHNGWSDHLRQKYPRRTSLKNRLRYFLGHQPKYRVWNALDGDTVCGLHAWLVTGRAPADSARLPMLHDGTHSLLAGAVARKSMERFTSDDWDRLLHTLFQVVQAPLLLDDLVKTVAALVDLEEDREVPLRDAGNEADTTPELVDHVRPGPERQAETRSMLRQLWGAVLALRLDYRRAYLLNLPGDAKSRGEIEIFTLHGIATIDGIAAAVDLEERHYEALFSNIPLTEQDRSALAGCRSDIERFRVLWRQLPLPDAAIGLLLGLGQQQVINRRMLALRELARLLAHPSGARGI